MQLTPAEARKMIEDLEYNNRLMQHDYPWANYPASVRNYLETVEAQDVGKRLSQREAEALNPDTPSERLKELAQDPSSLVREALARRPELDPEIQQKLLFDQSKDVSQAMVRRADLPAELIDRYINACDERSAQQLLLFNKQLNEAQLAAVYERFPNHEMARDVISHPNATPQMVDALVRNYASEHYSVAWVAAQEKRKELLPETLEYLADHPKDDIRSAVASAKQTPESVLQRLSQDEVDYVRREARNNLYAREHEYER